MSGSANPTTAAPAPPSISGPACLRIPPGLAIPNRARRCPAPRPPSRRWQSLSAARPSPASAPTASPTLPRTGTRTAGSNMGRAPPRTAGGEAVAVLQRIGELQQTGRGTARDQGLQGDLRLCVSLEGVDQPALAGIADAHGHGPYAAGLHPAQRREEAVVAEAPFGADQGGRNVDDARDAQIAQHRERVPVDVAVAIVESD